MKFTLQYSDVKDITSRLPQLLSKEDGRPQLQYFQFDFRSAGDDTATLTVTALDGRSVGAISMVVNDYDGPDKLTLFVPDFKIPTGAKQACVVNGVKCAVSTDSKTITLDFSVTKLILPLFQPVCDNARIKWSGALPDKDPVFTIYVNREQLEKALKIFNKDDAVRFTFYGPVDQVVMTQPFPVTAPAAVVFPMRVHENYNDDADKILFNLRSLDY